MDLFFAVSLREQVGYLLPPLGAGLRAAHVQRDVFADWAIQLLGDGIDLIVGDEGCTVYEDRPLQCRTWPFWQSNLKSPGTWEYTCNECPGAGKGRLVPLAKIEEYRGMIQI